jgi:hypothetical protein
VQRCKALTRAQHLTLCDVIADLCLVEHEHNGTSKDPRPVHNGFDVIELLLSASVLLRDDLLSSNILIVRRRVYKM